MFDDERQNGRDDADSGSGGEDGNGERCEEPWHPSQMRPLVLDEAGIVRLQELIRSGMSVRILTAAEVEKLKAEGRIISVNEEDTDDHRKD